MKLFKKLLVKIMLVILIFSCKRDIPAVANIEQLDPVNSSFVQVFNATVKSTRNYVYVDAVPLTGAALAFGGVFPVTAFAAKVNSGTKSITIKDTLPTSIQTPITFSQNMVGGKSYTIFTYDTVTSVKQITVLNNIVIPTDTSSMLRFANFIYNTTPLPNVDVYSFRKIPGTPVFVAGFPVLNTSTPVFSNIATTQITDFVPYPSGITDTLYVCATGTTLPIITKQLVVALVPTRSYTSAYSGSFKATKGVTTFATY